MLLLSYPSYSADLILKHQPVNYAFLDNINQQPPINNNWFSLPKIPSFTFTINNGFLKDITDGLPAISNFTFTDLRLNVSYTYDKVCDYANKILIDVGEITTSFTAR